uniref:Uncharacterized protein n=1 Tax=Glossina austeni TaxID=7395 RepID=A0A1A9UWB7_GLOAU
MIIERALDAKVVTLTVLHCYDNSRDTYGDLLRLHATSCGRLVPIAALRSGGSALSTKFSLEQNDASHCGCDDYRLTLRRMLWRNIFAKRAPVAVVYDGGGVYFGGASSGLLVKLVFALFPTFRTSDRSIFSLCIRLVKSMTLSIFPVTTIKAIRANGPSSTTILPNDFRPLHSIEKTLIQIFIIMISATDPDKTNQSEKKK